MNKIQQAISWANKRLELQGKKLDDVQIEVLTFALQNIAREISSSAVLAVSVCEHKWGATYGEYYAMNRCELCGEVRG